MRPGVALTLLLAGCRAPPAPALPPHRVLAGPEALVEVVAAASPRILGVGELHATVDRPGEPAALDWFTDGLLPLLAPSATDLVIETWVFPGDCGAAEEVLAASLPEDTRRPPETEDAITRLARRASELGVTPHALELTCEDYTAVVDAQGEVVYDRLLGVMTRELRALALQGLATPDARVILYGGAVHNDLHPREALAAYSYATAVAAQDSAAYLELDLYPPAAAMAQPGFGEEPWFPLVAGATGADHLVLYEREPHSLIALLPTEGGE
ncbi:MAG: hypothetical protein ABIO70_05015 [Pseudomonadota bacterium]